MTRDEVIDVLTIVAAGDRRTVGEADVTLWCHIIGALPKPLALRAVVEHRRERPGVWLEPGHIVARARAIRRDEWERTAISDRAAMQDMCDRKALPEVHELAASKAIPLDAPKYARPSQRPPDPLLQVPCPWPPCRAKAGQPCTSSATRQPMKTGIHPARREALGAAQIRDKERCSK